jgi:hypothetical protein
MHSTTRPNIENYIQNNLISELPNLLQLLLNGDLKKYEEDLIGLMTGVQNCISEEMLTHASSEIYDELVEQEKKEGGGNIEARKVSIRTASGYTVKVVSPYVKRTKKLKKGRRHLLSEYWAMIKGCSPVLYDRVGYCAAICPSYDLSFQTLSKFGVTICLSCVQDVTNCLANRCYEYGEEKLQLNSEENLVGKRVIISIDGGRTLTRDYGEELNKNGQRTYEANWREPKLFVIDILDKDGNLDRRELPIYGCRFDETDTLDLLERYLKRLRIHKAKQVQIIADGALWIWDKMKPLLLKLEVPVKRIVETLDYYHASEYIHRLVKNMPTRVEEKERKKYLRQFKELLWEGRSARITQICGMIYKRPGELIKRWMKYLKKHQQRTQYAVYKEDNLMCGSGIIESGIRRIINLRFKNTSTFWKKENVEKLYFLRAALLSKRWDIVMENISKYA